MKTHLLSFLIFAFASMAFAQNGVTPFGTPATPRAPAPAAPATPPSAPAPAPAAPAAAPGATTAGDYSSGTAERSTDKIFDVNKDSVDLQNGTMQWKGKTFNLGDNRVLRARLERYLASPKPSDDAVKHAKILDEIESLLSPRNITPKNYMQSYQQAWDLLFKAGEFESDGENCLTIASQVMKVQRDKQEARQLVITKNQQNSARKTQSTKTISKARELEFKKDAAANRSIAVRSGGKKGEGGGGSPGVADVQEGTEEIAAHRAELAKIDANIRKTEAGISALQLKTKLEFQSQIVALLFQRRFKHAMIAAAFYRHTFEGSAHELKVGDKEIKGMLPLSNFSPTIDSIDMVARAALTDVDVGMKAVLQLYEHGNRYKALERLQETFCLGEYCPQIMFFDPEKKTVLSAIWLEMQGLQRVGDERDLAAAEEIVKKIRAVADDFPAAQVISRINNAKRASNLALFAAKQAAFSGDATRVELQLERAAKIWPQNPAIEDFTRLVENRSDAAAQKIPEFDVLLKDGKLRDIFKQKEAFALALLQDKERTEKLKAALETVGKVDGAIMQARVLKDQGNGYMAWDALQMATGISSEDPELGRARMDLAPVVADYTRALANAEKEEKAAHYAASLAWYLTAQDLNAGSELCRQAVKRLSAAMLEAGAK